MVKKNPNLVIHAITGGTFSNDVKRTVDKGFRKNGSSFKNRIDWLEEKFVRCKINKELGKVRKELLQTSGPWEYVVVHWTGPNYPTNIFNNLSWLRTKQNVYKKWVPWRIAVGLNWGNT